MRNLHKEGLHIVTACLHLTDVLQTDTRVGTSYTIALYASDASSYNKSPVQCSIRNLLWHLVQYSLDERFTWFKVADISTNRTGAEEEQISKQPADEYWCAC